MVEKILGGSGLIGLQLICACGWEEGLSIIPGREAKHLELNPYCPRCGVRIRLG